MLFVHFLRSFAKLLFLSTILFISTISSFAQRGQLPAAGTWSGTISTGFSLPGDDLTKNYSDYHFWFYAQANIGVNIRPQFKLMFSFGGGQLLSGTDSLQARTSFYSASIVSQLSIPLSRQVSPLIFLRLGRIFFKPSLKSKNGKTDDVSRESFTYGIGVGIEFFISQTSSLTLTTEGNLTQSDNLDLIASGKQNDGYELILLSFTQYFSSGFRR